MTAEAHCEVMRCVKPGLRETFLASRFRSYCLENYNCKILPYSNICACGPNAATLHYVVNNDIITDSQMCLLDMGHAVQQYGSDVTCSYPSNGKFTQKQKDIYLLTLKSSAAVFKAAKPGVTWPEMHLLAEKVILKGLQELGIIKADVDLTEAQEKRVGFLFMPHGLGHLIGLDTHDVGGYLEHCPPRSDKLGLKNLRFSRELQERMYVTIEPGIYFIDFMQEGNIDLGFNVPDYVNVDLVKEYSKEVSGVRIEDDVIITADGNECFSPVPRSIAQIEACMAGEVWQHLPAEEFDLSEFF